jgi:voltage-gated potassium channel Kch
MSNQHDPESYHRNRSHVTLQGMRSRVQPGSFPLLLGAGLLFYVLNGVAVDLPAHAIVGRVAVACAGLYVLSASRTTLWLGVLVVALSITFEAHLWTLDPRVSRVLQDGMMTGFYLWVVVVVLREVFRPRTSEVDAVVGALCGFLLILQVFMRVHALIEALRPDSYRTNGPPFSERSDTMLVAGFQYFSTITLTTVGFGDIVPVTPLARLVTGLEAIVGQLYLAVVIATLVGRVAARRVTPP